MAQKNIGSYWHTTTNKELKIVYLVWSKLRCVRWARSQLIFHALTDIWFAIFCVCVWKIRVVIMRQSGCLCVFTSMCTMFIFAPEWSVRDYRCSMCSLSVNTHAARTAHARPQEHLMHGGPRAHQKCRISLIDYCHEFSVRAWLGLRLPADAHVLSRTRTLAPAEHQVRRLCTVVWVRKTARSCIIRRSVTAIVCRAKCACV